MTEIATLPSVHLSPRAKRYLTQRGWSFEQFVSLYPLFHLYIEQNSLLRIEEATIRSFLLQQEQVRSIEQRTITMSADARSVQRSHKQYKTQNKTITLNDMFLYICSRVLAECTFINSLREDGNQIVEHSSVHLSFMVNSPSGVLMPVLRNAHTQSLNEISQNAKILIHKCRNNSIDAQSLKGATFTISNFGSYGIEHYTPVLTIPQTGILGISPIVPQARYTADGGVSFKPYVTLSFSFDSRAYNEVQAAGFLHKVSLAIAHFSPSSVV